jgi:hypothetical protein
MRVNRTWHCVRGQWCAEVCDATCRRNVARKRTTARVAQQSIPRARSSSRCWLYSSQKTSQVPKPSSERHQPTRIPRSSLTRPQGVTARQIHLHGIHAAVIEYSKPNIAWHPMRSKHDAFETCNVDGSTCSHSEPQRRILSQAFETSHFGNFSRPTRMTDNEEARIF